MHPALTDEPRRTGHAARQRPHGRRVGQGHLLLDDFSLLRRDAHFFAFPDARPTALMAGARVSHKAMVTTIAVI